MSHHTPFAVLLSFAPLLAQDLLPSPIQPVGDRSAVTRSAGLQPSRDGVGLHGGGAHYRATFTGAGMRFEPALGRAAPTLQHLSLRPLRVQRGGTDVLQVAAADAPAQVERAAHYTRAPGIVERFDVRADGVELSWTFATNNTEVRGQLVSGAGALVGSTIFFSSNGLADRVLSANRIVVGRKHL